MKPVILIVSLVCCSCAGDRPPPGAASEQGQQAPDVVVTDSTRLGGYRLTVVNEADRCFLEVAGPSETDRLALVPAPPCYFLRRESNALQSFSYPEAGVQAVLIVAGTPIDDAKRSQWNLPVDLVCGEEAQGVLLTVEGVRLSRQVRKGGVACRDKGLDEKDFRSLAQEDGAGALD